MPALRPGNPVYIRDLDRRGTVKQVLPGRTYIVAAGNDVRRNRSALVDDKQSNNDLVSSPTAASEQTPVNAPRRPRREIRPPRRLIEEC